MRPAMCAILATARERAGISERDLCVGYYALGGTATPATLNAYLDGTVVPSAAEYDVVAQTLNEFFMGRGEDHPVP